MIASTDLAFRRFCYGILLAVALSGCSSVIRAHVIDAETKRPIPGAVVVGVWTKVTGPRGMTSHQTVGVRETETDGNGRFELERLPSSGLDFEGGGQAVTVYKFGYVAWSNLSGFPGSRLRANQRIPPTIVLDRFPPHASHRRHLDFISDVTQSELSRERTPKFLDAIAKEYGLP